MQLILRITTRCNFKCDFCSATQLSHNVDLSIDDAIDMIKKYLPTFDYEMRYYPIEQFTDKNVRFLSAEIIREKVLLLYNEEIPHGVAVQLTKFDESEDVIKIIPFN